MPENAIMPLSVVPQIFYDLIARVIPGSAILILGYLTWLGPAKATQTLLSEALQKMHLNLELMCHSLYWPIFWELSCMNYG